MFHLVMTIRAHRTPAWGNVPVRHEWSVGDPGKVNEGADLAAAVALCKDQMARDYADPYCLQNEDRTVKLDTAALAAQLNK